MNKLRITSPDGRVSIAPLGNLDYFEVYNSRVKEADKYAVEEIDDNGNVIAVHLNTAKATQLDVISIQNAKIKELEAQLKKATKNTTEPLKTK